MSATVESPPSTSCLVFRDGGSPVSLHDADAISDVLTEPDAFVWFDSTSLTPDDAALLQREFGLHPLALEDVTAQHEQPKIEAYEGYWLAIVHGISGTVAKFTIHELAVIVGEKFVITMRTGAPYPLDEIERRWLREEHKIRRDAGTLLYTILDTVVDGYSVLATEIVEEVNDIEDEVFQHPKARDFLYEIFQLKRGIQRFRRAVAPMREVLAPILRGDLKIFPQKELAYYRDVNDHAERVLNELDAARDAINSALDLQVSLGNARQTEVSKQLTIIATIFLPLTWVTGFFGQNFAYLVDWIKDEKIFWVYGVGSEIVATVLLLAYFRYKKWF